MCYLNEKGQRHSGVTRSKSNKLKDTYGGRAAQSSSSAFKWHGCVHQLTLTFLWQSDDLTGSQILTGTIYSPAFLKSKDRWMTSLIRIWLHNYGQQDVSDKSEFKSINSLSKMNAGWFHFRIYIFHALAQINLEGCENFFIKYFFAHCKSVLA